MTRKRGGEWSLINLCSFHFTDKYAKVLLFTSAERKSVRIPACLGGIFLGVLGFWGFSLVFLGVFCDVFGGFLWCFWGFSLVFLGVFFGVFGGFL